MVDMHTFETHFILLLWLWFHTREIHQVLYIHTRTHSQESILLEGISLLCCKCICKPHVTNLSFHTLRIPTVMNECALTSKIEVTNQISFLLLRPTHVQFTPKIVSSLVQDQCGDCTKPLKRSQTRTDPCFIFTQTRC